mmetsp:Transcript_16115/g.62847  ORF Transcript_16115/g.62847 Transcript_16115/m.62847 type:complete len:218 (-) Transcript_16115:566-1219(-)
MQHLRHSLHNLLHRLPHGIVVTMQLLRLVVEHSCLAVLRCDCERLVLLVDRYGWKVRCKHILVYLQLLQILSSRCLNERLRCRVAFNLQDHGQDRVGHKICDGAGAPLEVQVALVGGSDDDRVVHEQCLHVIVLGPLHSFIHLSNALLHQVEAPCEWHFLLLSDLTGRQMRVRAQLVGRDDVVGEVLLNKNSRNWLAVLHFGGEPANHLGHLRSPEL